MPKIRVLSGIIKSCSSQMDGMTYPLSLKFTHRWKSGMIEKCIAFGRETGVSLHICHVTAADSVALCGSKLWPTALRASGMGFTFIV